MFEELWNHRLTSAEVSRRSVKAELAKVETISTYSG
jgi:hypothetical protein